MRISGRLPVRFSRARLLAAIASGYMVIAGPMSFADDFYWTGAISTAWSDPDNWSNSGGDIDGIPDSDDSVFFEANTFVNRSGTFQSMQAAQNITVANGITVEILSLGIRAEAGTISNAGTLIVSGGGTITELDITGVVNLGGGGTLVLEEFGTSEIQDAGSAGRWTDYLVNIDNIIRGEGRIRVALVNQNLVRVEGNTLEVHSVDNQAGRFEVASDGNLRLDNITFDTERFVGGTIDFEAGGTLEGAGYFQDVTLTGDAKVDGSGVFEDTLTNLGTLTLLSSSSNTGRITMVGDARLEGGGTIVLDNETFGTARIRASSSDNPIVNVDNVIRGHGAIDGPFINQSLIRVEGGTLFGTGVAMDNIAGRIEVATDGFLLANITGGDIHGESGATLTSSRLKDVTFTGEFNVDSHGPAISGSINNQAELSGSEDIGILGMTTLSGGGTITFDNTADNNGGFSSSFTAEIPQSEANLINLDNTIRFEHGGFIDPDFENHGTLILTHGHLRSNGDLALHDTSMIQVIELSDNRVFPPQIIVSGDLLIDGALDLILLSPYGEDDEGPLISAASISGTFDSVSVTGLDEGLGIELLYSDTAVRYRVVSQPIPEPTSAVLLAGGALLLRRRRVPFG